MHEKDRISEHVSHIEGEGLELVITGFASLCGEVGVYAYRMKEWQICEARYGK